MQKLLNQQFSWLFAVEVTECCFSGAKRKQSCFLGFIFLRIGGTTCQEKIKKGPFATPLQQNLPTLLIYSGTFTYISSLSLYIYMVCVYLYAFLVPIQSVGCWENRKKNGSLSLGKRKLLKERKGNIGQSRKCYTSMITKSILCIGMSFTHP